MRRVAALLAACLLAAACRSDAVAPTATPTLRGGTLRVAMGGEVTTLDPWNADAASLVAVRQVFDTLVGVDPGNGQIVPGLAQSWQASSDGLRWTFTLRQDVRFHDGTRLDAAAVAASFERARNTRDPRRGIGAFAAYRALFGGFDDQSVIARTEAVDARTVRFDLRAGYGAFLAHLALPPAAIARGPAGTGPFVAAAGGAAGDGTTTLSRNPAYGVRDSGGAPLPYLDALVLVPVSDAGARLAELRAGRADLALDLPIGQAVTARGDPSLSLAVRRDASLASLAIDASRPPFDRVEVRRAVAVAVDRNALSTALYFGFARAASQVVPPGMLGSDETVSEPVSTDVAAARKLVADVVGGPAIEVDLGYVATPSPTYPEPQRIASAVAADLAKIGIVARPRAIDPAAARDADAPALQLEATAIGVDPDDVFSPLFVTSAGGATAWGWNQGVAGGLLMKARAESDPTKRTELYKQVSKMIRAEVPRVPLLFVGRAAAASRKVTGYVAAPAGRESFVMVFTRP